jgi:gas vesicle protein
MGKKVVGAGLVSIAAVGAAVAAFFYGKDGAKKRKKLKGWMVKAKGEVLDKLENSKTMSEERYHDLVESVTKKYTRVSKATAPERKRLEKDLKTAWKKIAKELNVN